MRSEKSIKKQTAFNDIEDFRLPHKIKLFPKNPRTYGNPLPDVPSLDQPT